MLNLDKNKNYLLACSFGPDSMALFDMLEKENYHFVAALVNYHIRPESDEEMKSFVHYCEDHKITYHVKNLISGVNGKNLEAECRKIRYEFFADLVNKFHYDAVLVAHNQDDLLETYLMQKRRQNLVIFYGIQEKTIINGVQIVRPLLNFSKQELLEYCESNKVPFSIDKTNFDHRYLRNNIRHNIVSKMNKEARQKLLEEINDKNVQINETNNKLQNMDLHDVDTLITLTDFELAIALNILIKEIDDSLFVSMRQTKEVKKILLNNKGNVDVPVRNGVVIRRSYSKVECIKASSNDYSFVIEKPMEFDCGYFHLDFTNDSTNRNVHLDDYPLTIRNYRKGDKYSIKDYEVQVRRLFIDWKMPLSLRKRWPIILNRDNKIIYIPRYQKDFVPTDNCNFYVK